MLACRSEQKTSIRSERQPAEERRKCLVGVDVTSHTKPDGA